MQLWESPLGNVGG